MNKNPIKTDRTWQVLLRNIIRWQILGLLVLALSPAVHSVPADFYLIEIYPQTVEPGETATLNITLKNLAPNYAVYLGATLDPDDASPIDAVGIPKRYINRAKEADESSDYFGAISQREEIHLSMPVYVKQDAVEGVYQVPLVLKWKNELLEDVTQTLYMGIRVKGNAMLRVAKVTTSPVEFRPGMEKGKVTITVENAGKTAAKSVKVDVEFSGPFMEAYSASSSDFVLEIAPDEAHDFVVSLDIEDGAPDGVYALPLNVTYRTTDASYEMNDEINIRINSEAEFEVLDARSDPPIITPGDNFIINIPLKNIGQKKAESIKAVIKTKSFFTGTKSDYLGDMKPGDEKLATFELEVDRDTLPDNYNSDIMVIWKEGDERYEEVYSFVFQVSEKPGSQEVIGGISGIGVAAGVAVLIGIAGIVTWRRRR